MFLWNMSLETGIPDVDRGRKHLLDAMADFFQGMDDPALSQHLLATRTGAIFNAMKAAFAAEDAFLQQHDGDEAEKHRSNHAAVSGAFVDLCRKLVPKIKNQKQARQCCLEIYQLVDEVLFHHIGKEVAFYRGVARSPVKKVG